MFRGNGLYSICPGHDGDIEAVVTLWQQLRSLILRDGDSPAGVQRFLAHAQGKRC
jgi:hypothetical protein